MALAVCPECGEDEELEKLRGLEDGRRQLKCSTCGHEWAFGEPREVTPPRVPKKSSSELRTDFVSKYRADDKAKARADELKRRYLIDLPATPSREAEFRKRYREAFSEEGLRSVSPSDLKYFANANIAGNPGNMSMFNTAWNELGEEEAASRVREAVHYLLYGPGEDEDRLTTLIEGRRVIGITGFREALLTKVLCMVHPQRFLPINKYTGQAGKREIARAVYGLVLPTPGQSRWTIGRLIYWSNDLLLDLAGDGFSDGEHVAGFLWWAKDQTIGPVAARPEEPDFIVFRDDDDGFRERMKLHPSGFYLNAARNPSSDAIFLHRVGCWHVVDAEPGTTWTTDFIKICSMSRLELEAWARTTAGVEARPCQTCTP